MARKWMRYAMRNACGDTATPETVKYCPAIFWDGAQQQLQPLPDWIESEWQWAQQHPDQPSSVITPKELQQVPSQ